MEFILDSEILYSLAGVLTLIIIKTVLTWIIAFKIDEFDIREAPRFLITNVLPYVAGLLVLAVPSIWLPEIKILYFSIVTVVSAKYLAEIKDRIIYLFEAEIPDNIAS
jgi:hypothetical protein